MNEKDRKYPEPADDGPGLLVSLWFWLGAVACLAVWAWVLS